MLECAQRVRMQIAKNKLLGQVITDIVPRKKKPSMNDGPGLPWSDCALQTQDIIKNSKLRLQRQNDQKKHQAQHGGQCKCCKVCKLSCCLDLIGNIDFNCSDTFISPRNCPLWVVK